MTDDKVYTPETVVDNPYPQTESVVAGGSQKSTGDVHNPQTVSDTPLPKTIVAREVLSSVLNTKSKKILGQLDFAPSGAIQIGVYKQDENGDIKISPLGIVARNSQGEATITVDGETGDVTIKGTLAAGSVIVGDTIVHEQASNGNGRTVYYDENGIPAIVIGDPS